MNQITLEGINAELKYDVAPKDLLAVRRYVLGIIGTIHTAGRYIATKRLVLKKDKEGCSSGFNFIAGMKRSQMCSALIEYGMILHT